MGSRIQRYAGPKMNGVGSGTANAVAIVAGARRSRPLVCHRGPEPCHSTLEWRYAYGAGHQPGLGVAGIPGPRGHAVRRVDGWRHRCGPHACSSSRVGLVLLAPLRAATFTGTLLAHLF